MATLQEIIREEFGKRAIERTEIPSYILANLAPSKPLRPYQREALQYALTYFDNDFNGKEIQPDLLFQMATGAGKTLIMAAMILFLYKRGYRNFLFFVNTNNIIGKTKENFFNPSSTKYLFADTIAIDDQRIALNMVDNFQHVNHNTINICLTTIQQLHIDLANPKEGSLTFDDFACFKTVMISDEAHHINASTRKSNPTLPGTEGATWENTAIRIFQSNENNVLLEFTATSGMDNDANLAAKYEPKLIFDYALKQYRKDGFSKEVETVQTSAEDFYRALSAVVLSQFKLKMFESIGLQIKPVVMFKSKTIIENKAFYETFIQLISHLSVNDLEQVKSFAKDDIRRAFDYFDRSGITLDNLLLEIREDFSAERLLIVDQKNIDESKQVTLNSLESPDNQVRCVFAVDMLNEGWDVLNLFDIVRMYETRDAKNSKPGKTTIQEAQLIGRGARYMPFLAPGSDIQADMRKFDHDIENPLRVLEKLHYHTAANSRYVDELRKALIDSGIANDNLRECTLKLKPAFKETALYLHGVVFTNERKGYTAPESNDSFSESVISHTFRVELPKRQMKSDTIFERIVSDSGLNKYGTLTMRSLGAHVVRAALNSNPEFSFRHIKQAFPPLASIEEFITSHKFLSALKIDIAGGDITLENLSQSQKLFVAQQVLKQLSPMIFKKLGTYEGTRKFTPRDFKDVFKDHTLRFCVDQGSAKENGVSMRTPRNLALRLDLATCEWYAYNDCFGTSEEKYLIKYIESIIEKLREKYCDIYLVRNELDLKIYAFEDGAAFKPDFVLFMRHKDNDEIFDNIQIFIEPKGAHLEASDQWKEDFLLLIGKDSILSFETPNNKFRMWGLPFFRENKKSRFDKAMKESLSLL